MSFDPYAVLGLNRGASKAEINRAFRRLAKKHHPDVNPGDASAEGHFKTLTAAYEQLTGKAKGPTELAPPARYDFQYLTELEDRIREQRRQKKNGGMLGSLTAFLKGRFS